MRVDLLTREFPPDVYGGAGVHVEYLARDLAERIDLEIRCFGADRDGAVAFQPWEALNGANPALKTMSVDLAMSAQVDGASVLRQFFQLTLPLCRPPLAALATLQVTWIYNEFFWATVLLQSGDKFPVTSSLNNLKGQFFVDYNLLSAGSVVVALPPILVFFLLQRHLVSGLTLGATKG